MQDVVSFLKENITIKGLTVCAKELGLKNKQVREILAKNKLPLSKSYKTKTGIVKKRWTEDELDILRKYYPQGGSVECKKHLIERANQDIVHKARSIGLYYGDNDRFTGKGLNNKTCTVGQTHIICKRCKQNKPANNTYYTFRKDRKQYHTTCKACRTRNQQDQRTIEDKFLKQLWYRALKRRENKNSITYPQLCELWLKQSKKCALTGLEMTTNVGEGRCMTNVSIDRIDNNQDYIYENVQLVCFWANVAKNNLEQSDFITMCKNVVNNIQ